MKRRSSISIFLFFALLSLSVVTLIEPVHAYDNSKLGYSINLPEGWTIDDSMEKQIGQVMFNAPQTDAYINMAVTISHGDSALELINSLKQSRSRVQSENFTVLSEGPFEIGDLTGYKIEYTIVLGGSQHNVRTFVSVKNGQQYSVSWGTLSYPYNLASLDIENSLNSIKILSSQFNVSIENKDYPINVISNSTISEFTFNATTKELNFQATGLSGTAGYCTITVPVSLIWGELSVYKDGVLLVKNVDYSQTNDGESNIFLITFNHSNHNFMIVGTEAIPEFPICIVLLLTAIITTIVLFLKKKRIN